MNILYITYPLSGLLMVAMPVALGIYLTRRFNLGWRLWWIGAATFILSQVGHIPFNIGLTSLFNQGVLPTPPTSWQLPFNAIVLGLSAGLWEEMARYAMYRWWVREARSWGKGLLLGAGHGGVEAILLGVVLFINFVVFTALRNAELTQILSVDQLAIAQEQIDAFWSVPWYNSMLGALERAFTIPVQLSFSIIVLQVFTRKQAGWLWLAVLWHALIDAMAVYSSNIWGIYLTEALLGIAMLGSLGLIFGLRQRKEDPQEDHQAAPPLKNMRELPEEGESPESLDKTRYN
jgi:uncharacterized membrane protein YhfC